MYERTNGSGWKTRARGYTRREEFVACVCLPECKSADIRHRPVRTHVNGSMVESRKGLGVKKVDLIRVVLECGN